MDISRSNGRVGFVQFAHKIMREDIIGLGASVNMGKTALKAQILRSHYLNGGTQISLGLEEALALFAREGRTDGAAKYVIVLSDGESSDVEGITAAMKKISASNIQTFVIGVGQYSMLPESKRQLLEIAGGNSRRVFHVDNYDQLNEQLLKEVMITQCQ